VGVIVVGINPRNAFIGRLGIRAFSDALFGEFILEWIRIEWSSHGIPFPGLPDHKIRFMN
jgi:hypothetical protein